MCLDVLVPVNSSPGAHCAVQRPLHPDTVSMNRNSPPGLPCLSDPSLAGRALFRHCTA